jgi:glycosyltransferase involved in cell wall biosynthesis
MCTAGFPEPMTFSLRAARHLLPRAAEFDVVHDNQSLGWGLLRLTRAGVPTVATVHHPIAIDRELELAATRSLRRRLTLRRWYGFTGMQARVAARLDAVTTVSENSRRDIATHMGLSPEGIEVIPVGIDPDEFTPPPPGQPRDRDSILVITSADVALKGLVHLLEALAKLRTERPVRLTVVGTARPGGPAETALDRLALRDAVRFTGPVPEAELVDLLQRASVVAIPSLYEGFSLPAIEAMACATPLIASRGGALPEVVGDCGVLVEPGNPSDLAGALGRLLEDEPRRTALGAAGRRRVQERFTWRAMAAATAAVYADVVEQRAGPC